MAASRISQGGDKGARNKKTNLKKKKKEERKKDKSHERGIIMQRRLINRIKNIQRVYEEVFMQVKGKFADYTN